MHATDLVSHIFFDLDGTLADSLPGIMDGINFACEKMGAKAPLASEVRGLIGAPLLDILKKYVPDRADEARGFYHDRYAVQGFGVTGNTVFDDIKPLMQALYEQEIQLFVTTTKEEKVARKVMDHLGLNDFCVAIYGTVPETQRNNKGRVIAHALATHQINPDKTLMVGDRNYDVLGAKENGVRTVGITWGYGEEQELRAAGAAYIAHKPLEILDILRG